MKKVKVMGYKGFDKNLKCRGFQYEVGKTYEIKEDIRLCSTGFHFCRDFKNVDGYYNFRNIDYRFCEVEALGQVIDQEDGEKSVTNKIKIVREISRQEMYDTLNEGKGNTGFYNTGYSNTGDRNTGDRNTGDRNTGDRNKTNRSSGVLCNQEPKMMMFNKPTDMTWEEWKNTRAFDLLDNIQKNEWKWYDYMTDEEKTKYPSAKTCGGYLKEYTRAEAAKKWWNSLDIFDKNEIFSLPNFDLSVFNDIMELEITKKEYKEVLKNVKNS
jgi:hypothetical protein